LIWGNDRLKQAAVPKCLHQTRETRLNVVKLGLQALALGRNVITPVVRLTESRGPRRRS
jgi:hypothetical protein